MSVYKVSFLWLMIIIFWASCHYATCSDMTVGNLSVVFSNGRCPGRCTIYLQSCLQFPRNGTLTKDFCTMNVKQNTTSIGQCTTDEGKTFSFNITNYGDKYEVIMHETVRNITLLVQTDECLSSSIFQNLRGVPPKQLLTCESVTVCLRCDQGTIKVLSANYGRTDKVTCSENKPAEQLSNVQCTQSTSLSVMAKQCDGKQNCSIFVSNDNFNDPCSGTHKYLNVSYDCVLPPTPPPPGNNGSQYVLYVSGNNRTCVTCINLSAMRDNDTTPVPTSLTPSEASKLLDSLQPRADEMQRTNQSTAVQALYINGVKGLLYTQAKNTKTKDLTMFYSSDQDTISIIESSQNVLQTDFSWYVKISEEAFNKSHMENNRSAYVGVLLFKNMENNDLNHTVLNNEVYGISMGANISNLTDNIEIIIRQQNLVVNASCNSWDGKGELKWTTFGCDTEINKTDIKCSCSHLTFFAVLMSMPNQKALEHVESLTYITSIGCGLSMFFLAIALFMHFLLRKNKSNQATKILINMFVALFLLNLSFVSNESIANTQDSAACTVIALILHYSMLATFTWFLLQALHMYLWIIRQNITIKNYMRKITVSGWVCPSPIVVIIASLGEYKSVIFKASNDKITRMCWITNHYIHYIVNIGYYSVVFIFTTGIFITIVAKIIQAGKVGEVKRSTFRKQLTMILSLFLLLGLTWGVAFFSYGVMTIPSYYIFCVLNSFQGFFLFLYYYHIHNDVEGRFSDDPDRSDTSATNNQSSIDTVDDHVYN